MKHIELENELRAQMKKRRMVEAGLCIAFLIVIVVFAVLYAQSMVIEEIAYGPIKHQSITYNQNFILVALVGALGLLFAGIFLAGDFAFSKVVTFEVGNDFVTFYRGNTCTNLYVNGEQKDGTTVGYHLEASLSDGTKVNVALGKGSAHITFSNGHPPIDV